MLNNKKKKLLKTRPKDRRLWIINMKTIILYLLAIVIWSDSTAQSNNPYNDMGKRYFESVNKIVTDIKENGFKGNDQKSLDYYASLSSIQLKMNPALAAKLYEINSKPLNPSEIIKNSTVSQQSKDFTTKIISIPEKLNVEETTKYLENLSRDVKNSKLSEDEKSLNLMLISVANYSSQNRAHDSRGCTIETEHGPKWLSPYQCVLMGAAIGAYIGWEICGGWCAVGGAILIGVITAVAVC